MKKDWKDVYIKLQESWQFEETSTDEQEYTSAKTSRKQVAKIHTFLVDKEMIPPESLVLDWGGGKYDRSKEFIEANVEGSKLLTYDPFNRTEEHNAKVLSDVRSNNGADVVTLANVLNVIKEPSIRKSTIEDIKKFMKSGATLYISVYKAPKSKDYEETDEFVGQMTKDGWQNAQPINYYLPEVKESFPDAIVKNNIIIAKKQ